MLGETLIFCGNFAYCAKITRETRPYRLPESQRNLTRLVLVFSVDEVAILLEDCFVVLATVENSDDRHPLSIHADMV